MKTTRILIISWIVLLLLAGCNPKSPDAVPVTEPGDDGVPEGIEEESGYPVSPPMEMPEEGYPIAEIESEFPQGPEFIIDRPVKASDSTVSGTGPAGVPIKLIDVSEVGVVLAETTINADGTFTFTLQDPLQSGHSIGLQLGDVENTDFNPDDFLYSDTYYERPLVGILFDLLVVE
jgi:hypothetical protein